MASSKSLWILCQTQTLSVPLGSILLAIRSRLPDLTSAMVLFKSSSSFSDAKSSIPRVNSDAILQSAHCAGESAQQFATLLAQPPPKHKWNSQKFHQISIRWPSAYFCASFFASGALLGPFFATFCWGLFFAFLLGAVPLQCPLRVIVIRLVWSMQTVLKLRSPFPKSPMMADTLPRPPNSSSTTAKTQSMQYTKRTAKHTNYSLK